MDPSFLDTDIALKERSYKVKGSVKQPLISVEEILYIPPGGLPWPTLFIKSYPVEAALLGSLAGTGLLPDYGFLPSFFSCAAGSLTMMSSCTFFSARCR